MSKSTPVFITNEAEVNEVFAKAAKPGTGYTSESRFFNSNGEIAPNFEVPVIVELSVISNKTDATAPDYLAVHFGIGETSTSIVRVCPKGESPSAYDLFSRNAPVLTQFAYSLNNTFYAPQVATPVVTETPVAPTVEEVFETPLTEEEITAPADEETATETEATEETPVVEEAPAVTETTDTTPLSE